MVTIFLGVLAIAWICVGAQVYLQRRHEGRADSTVSSFRAQLSTLERATPGTMMRQSLTGPVPVVKVESAPARPSRPVMSPVQKRRRDVLLTIAGVFGSSLLLALVAGGIWVGLALLSGAALGAYVWALRQIRVRSMARPVDVGARRTTTVEVEGTATTVALMGQHQPVGGSTALPRSLAN